MHNSKKASLKDDQTYQATIKNIAIYKQNSAVLIADK
jgi:hypothetical protein